MVQEDMGKRLREETGVISPALSRRKETQEE